MIGSTRIRRIPSSFGLVSVASFASQSPRDEPPCQTKLKWTTTESARHFLKARRTPRRPGHQGQQDDDRSQTDPDADIGPEQPQERFQVQTGSRRHKNTRLLTNNIIRYFVNIYIQPFFHFAFRSHSSSSIGAGSCARALFLLMRSVRGGDARRGQSGGDRHAVDGLGAEAVEFAVEDFDATGECVVKRQGDDRQGYARGQGSECRGDRRTPSGADGEVCQSAACGGQTPKRPSKGARPATRFNVPTCLRKRSISTRRAKAIARSTSVVGRPQRLTPAKTIRAAGLGFNSQRSVVLPRSSRPSPSRSRNRSTNAGGATFFFLNRHDRSIAVPADSAAAATNPPQTTRSIGGVVRYHVSKRSQAFAPRAFADSTSDSNNSPLACLACAGGLSIRRFSSSARADDARQHKLKTAPNLVPRRFIDRVLDRGQGRRKIKSLRIQRFQIREFQIQKPFGETSDIEPSTEHSHLLSRHKFAT